MFKSQYKQPINLDGMELKPSDVHKIKGGLSLQHHHLRFQPSHLAFLNF